MTRTYPSHWHRILDRGAGPAWGAISDWTTSTGTPDTHEGTYTEGFVDALAVMSVAPEFAMQLWQSYLDEFAIDGDPDGREWHEQDAHRVAAGIAALFNAEVARLTRTPPAGGGRDG